MKLNFPKHFLSKTGMLTVMVAIFGAIAWAFFKIICAVATEFPMFFFGMGGLAVACGLFVYFFDRKLNL